MNQEALLHLQAESQKADRRPRLYDIDRAKGLMMIFVVLGHVSDPAGPEWANTFRALIYGFHMPFFMCLSGYIFAYTSAHVMKSNFARYVIGRANRLLVPFLGMAFIIINLKLASSSFMMVNKPVGTIWTAYISIFINTSTSPALAIWYLFVLFVFSVVTPVFFTISGNRFAPIWCAALGMYSIFFYAIYNDVLTDDFYISRMFWFYVFFVSGCVACTQSAVYMPFARKLWPAFLIAFIVLDYAMLSTEWRYLVVGLVSAVALHGLVGSSLLRRERVFAFIGNYSLSIYLFNTIFIGITRGVFAKISPPSDNMFLLYLISLPAGLFGPIFAKECLALVMPRHIIKTYLT